jgi:nucleoside-diphosphate-sugar epimerase
VPELRVGVLGATSFVGACLLPQLVRAGYQVTAFSRQTVEPSDEGVAWHRLPGSPVHPGSLSEMCIPLWICAAPLWALPEHLSFLQSCGARRVVALSSTSRFTKEASPDAAERAVARDLAQGEDRIAQWAESNGVAWILLRPTLIYGLGLDRNICEIARFVQRFGFFPVLGRADGLRQPVHVRDVATACQSVLERTGVSNCAYALSGAETLRYREMVARVFVALGRPERVLSIPMPVFRVALALLRVLPRFRQWSPAMAYRMQHDQAFDHEDAARDFDFAPQRFVLDSKDLPAQKVPGSPQPV